MFARLGTEALAASQIVAATESVFIVLSSGLATASLTLVGQDVGAGRALEAKEKARESMWLGFYAALVFGAALMCVSSELDALFPKVPPRVIVDGLLGLTLFAAFQPVKVLNMILSDGVLRAGGDAGYVLRSDIVAIYVIGLPTAAVLGFVFDFGPLGIFVGRLAEEIARVSFLIARYRTASWYPAARQAWTAAPWTGARRGHRWKSIRDLSVPRHAPELVMIKDTGLSRSAP
jgi:Na+-driven multidrug efflux pump